ncbi:CTP synthase [Candidatus Micrarchaeota archaeon]|nr:CTP synthase [Candidatus Micrarchaeota archaeon]
MPKFVFVTGGVLSSLGKGILVSSIAKLLKSAGVRASAMKIDPYLNCDAGTLNPFEHGEVFVTRDGFECDLDVGNYERFLNEFACREQNIMMGMVYRAVLEKERRGEFLGKTIQLIPHVTNEVKTRIRLAAQKTASEVLVVEIGGTVGDIESEIVLEAIRQMRFEETSGDVVNVHLALVPTIITGEQKTKPIQHSVRALLSRGIAPDFVVARCEKSLNDQTRAKIALFCNVEKEHVFDSPTVENVYELPLLLSAQGFSNAMCAKLGLAESERDLSDWRSLLSRWNNAERTVKIGVVGKYATTRDTYMSVFEALKHAGVHNDARVHAVLIDSEEVEQSGIGSGEGQVDLNTFDALVVPGGFGGRGIEGIISTIQFARENEVPYLGLCYGMQLAVIEFARNVLNWSDAHSTEIDESTSHPVIDLLPEQREVTEKGGTMRLGAKDVLVKRDTLVHSLYGKDVVSKRFRHRFEVNPDYVKELEGAGVIFSGRDPQKEIMKFMELEAHPFFIGTQAHPEFDSRLEEPEPLFKGLVRAAVDRNEKNQGYAEKKKNYGIEVI